MAQQGFMQFRAANNIHEPRHQFSYIDQNKARHAAPPWINAQVKHASGQTDHETHQNSSLTKHSVHWVTAKSAETLWSTVGTCWNFHDWSYPCLISYSSFPLCTAGQVTFFSTLLVERPLEKYCGLNMTQPTASLFVSPSTRPWAWVVGLVCHARTRKQSSEQDN